MKILNTSDLIIKLTDSKLQIIDLETLKEKWVKRGQVPVSMSLLSEDILICGHFDGSINKMCMKSFQIKKLEIPSKNKSTVNCLFTLDTFIYAGYNDGTIIKYKYTNSKINLFKTYKHTLPIINIISNGEQVLIYDMNKKVKSYPSLVVYDIINPILIYKYYVFLVEKSTLYCLTRDSLSSYLQINTTIKSIRFSENGGILFLLVFENLLIYDFNDKKLIREIFCDFTDFVYDETNNRIIGFNNKKKEVITDIVDMEYDEMKNIVFKENKIQEKVVKILEDEEYNFNYKDEEYYEDEYSDEGSNEESGGSKKENGSGSSKRVSGSKKENGSVSKKENGSGSKKENGSGSSNIGGSNMGGSKNNINSYTHSNSYTHDKNYTHDKSGTSNIGESTDMEDDLPHRRFRTHRVNKEKESVGSEGGFTYRNSSDLLLEYNNTGYLVSISGPEYRRVELRYHDRSRGTVELDDHNDCTTGRFYDSTIVLCNSTHFYYYSDQVWSRNLDVTEVEGTSTEQVQVAVNNKYVVVSSGLTKIYNTTGEVVFNFNITDVSYLVLNNNYIYVFASRLTIINLHRTTQEVSLPGLVKWGYVQNKKVFYCINNDIYILYKMLSYQVLRDIKYPLAVVGNKLICLDTSRKILPNPNVSYIELPANILEFISIEETSNEVVQTTSKQEDLVRVDASSSIDEDVFLD